MSYNIYILAQKHRRTWRALAACGLSYEFTDRNHDHLITILEIHTCSNPSPNRLYIQTLF